MAKNAMFLWLLIWCSPIVQSDFGMENLSCLGWDHMCIDKSSNHSVKHQIHNLTNLGREITIWPEFAKWLQKPLPKVKPLILLSQNMKFCFASIVT